MRSITPSSCSLRDILGTWESDGIRKSYPIGDGSRLEAGRAHAVLCGFNSRLFRCETANGASLTPSRIGANAPELAKPIRDYSAPPTLRLMSRASSDQINLSSGSSLLLRARP